MNSKSRNVRFLVAIGLSSAIGASNVAFADNPLCSDNGGNSPYVCVKKSGADPQELIDFEWGWGDPDNPDVILITGDTEWEVWSQVSDEQEPPPDPANLGDLLIAPAAQSSEYFTVKIANGGNDGAANLGSVVLDAEDWTGYSSITGGGITGNLNGNLTVKEDAGDNGGDINFEIDGSVTGNIEAYTITALDIDDEVTGNITVSTTITDLHIGGNPVTGISMDGNLTAEAVKHLEMDFDYDGIMDIGTIAENGDITIGGDVTGGSTIDVDEIDKGGVFEVKGAVKGFPVITLGDMSAATEQQPVWVRFNTTVPADHRFSGDLKLLYSIPEYATVRISGVTQYGADIDLYGGDVAGTLELERGGYADILNGGNVKDSGLVELANFGWVDAQPYSGTAEFVDVEDETGGLVHGGRIKTCAETTTLSFNGILTVADLYGRIDITGRLDGDIAVTGAMKGGWFQVWGDVLSNANIDVADMLSESGQNSRLEFQRGFSGDLDLMGGIGTDQVVRIDGEVDGSIDLNNADVAGYLFLASVLDTGTISNGGSVSDLVNVGGGAGHFDGTATFASVGSTGRIQLLGSSDLNGDLTIDGSMGGTISLGRDLTSDGRISIGDDLTGEITVAGDVAGDINIADDVSGEITIDGDLSGDIDIDDANSGAIDVQGTLKSSGRILIDGLCIGEITIGEETEQLSQIVIYGGLDDFAGPPAKVGSITINNKGEDFDANGTIHIGPSWTLPPPDVVFDGWILIQKEDGGPGGGDLGDRGRIEVFGCHATEDDLDICICGDVNGTIDIEQTGCTNQVTWSCSEHWCFPDE